MAGKFILVALICFTLYAMANADCNKCEEKVCMCTREFVPVCGENGKWYSNLCEMECAGVKVDENECCNGPKPGLLFPPPEGETAISEICANRTCGCSMEMNPICGTDGVWYNNLCSMECFNVKEDKDECCVGPAPGQTLG